MAGTIAAAPLVAACESGGAKGPGTTSAGELGKILPQYVPNTSVKPDIPSVVGANGAISDPVFLQYPSSPVQTVSGAVGKGGTYTTMTPLWGAIPPSDGNSYYDAVNKAIGATLKMQPSDGNNYGNQLPALFSANKLPDWIQIPGWNTGNLNFGQAVSRFVDLTPHLAGDKIKQYPNLANIPSGAWAAGVWNGKLYGLPVYPSTANFSGAVFYRKDIFDKHGINADSIKTPDDLAALGKELTSASAGVWAFDEIAGGGAYILCPLFHIPNKWKIDSGGKLVHKYETPELIEALNWHAKLVKAGYVHPDGVAGNNQNGGERFHGGKVVISSGGTGAWNGDDAKAGTAANPGYNRQAFKLLSSSGTPAIELGAGAGMFAYLNGKLSEDQVKECLAIANYLAAPYGSAEWLTVNYGAEGVSYTMKDGNPLLTERGSKEVATSFQFLVTAPAVTTVGSGFVQVAKDYAAWQADTVKYAVKPAFYAMNIVEPSQYASIDQPMIDMIADVKVGRKSIADYQEAVKTWQSQGGNALRDFYAGIRDKHGTGQ
ncbi:MAG: extracellular solute-binding protein [Hamadaea sp.]|nr:extracellular solute-binding protein [Hamadaea sp.]